MARARPRSHLSREGEGSRGPRMPCSLANVPKKLIPKSDLCGRSLTDELPSAPKVRIRMHSVPARPPWVVLKGGQK